MGGRPRATGQVAGTLLLKALPDRENEPTSDIEVGWHLHPDSWGHGYATEAARGAVDRAFADGLAEIYAVVKPGNEPSMAVARRLGMTPLGRTTRWYGGVELEFSCCPARNAALKGRQSRDVAFEIIGRDEEVRCTSGSRQSLTRSS